MVQRKVMAVALVFILSLTLTTNAFAKNLPVYKAESNKIIYSSPIPNFAIYAPCVWATYTKTVVLESISDKEYPSFKDWPQSIYYTEPNPAGGDGDASGTLYLKNAEKLSGMGSVWKLTYRGEMGFYT